jgi:tRNA(Ile)-lysidine synthase
MNADTTDTGSSAGVLYEHQLAGLFASLAVHPHVALAVSGGADSVALMLMVRNWLNQRSSGPQITIITVDHRLRDAAASEAEWVKRTAQQLGFQHETLVWNSAKPHAGLQAEARRARYDLLTAFCRATSIPAIATAHTSNDQAETFIMRLARGSGLDGLSAMAEISRRDGIDILRPLLTMSRQWIEAFLLAQRQPWLDDPSNDDDRYERARIRRQLKEVQSLGLSPARLVLSAKRLRRARDALELVTLTFLQAKVSLDEAGFAKLRLPDLFDLHEDIALRALVRMILAVGGGSTVRLSKIETYYQMMRGSPGNATLGGCRLIKKDEGLTIMREIGRMGALSQAAIQPGQTLLWDGRFKITYVGQNTKAAILRPLGIDGMQAIKAAAGYFGPVPRLAAMTLPSLWNDSELCYAPFVKFPSGEPDGWHPDSHAEFAHVWDLPANFGADEAPPRPGW